MTRMVSITTPRCTRIHMRSCHMAQRGRAQDWPPGDTRHRTQLAIDAARLGFRPCRRCRPFPNPDPALMPGYERPVGITLGRAEAQIGVV